MNKQQIAKSNTAISSIRTFSKDAESLRQKDTPSKISIANIPKPTTKPLEKESVPTTTSEDKKDSLTAIPKPTENKKDDQIAPVPKPQKTEKESAVATTAKAPTTPFYEDKRNQELKEKATKKISASTTQLKEKPSSILESTNDKNTINTKEPEAVLVRDVKRKKVSFFGSVAEGIIGGLTDLKNTYITPEKPSYTITKSTRRAGVLESAKPKTGTALVQDKNIAERIRKKYEQNNELTDIDTVKENIPTIHKTDFTEEIEASAESNKTEKERPHNIEVVPRKKAGVLNYIKNNSRKQKKTPSAKFIAEEKTLIDNKKLENEKNNNSVEKQPLREQGKKETKLENDSKENTTALIEINTTKEITTNNKKDLEHGLKAESLTKKDNKSNHLQANFEKKQLLNKLPPAIIELKKDSIPEVSKTDKSFDTSAKSEIKQTHKISSRSTNKGKEADFSNTQKKRPVPKPPVRQKTYDEQAGKRWGVTDDSTKETKHPSFELPSKQEKAPVLKGEKKEIEELPFTFTYNKPGSKEVFSKKETDGTKSQEIRKDKKNKAPTEADSPQKVQTEIPEKEPTPTKIKDGIPKVVTSEPNVNATNDIEPLTSLADEKNITPLEDIEVSHGVTDQSFTKEPALDSVEYIYPSENEEVGNEEEIPKDNSTNELSLKILFGTVFLFAVGVVGLNVYNTHFVPVQNPDLLIGDSVTVFRLEDYPTPEARYTGLIEKAQTTSNISHIAIYEPRNQTSIRQKVSDVSELLNLTIEPTVRSTIHNIHFGAIDGSLEFVLFEITDNRQALGGMLQWEPQLQEVFSPLFGEISGDLQFIDVNSRNSDVRAGRNQDEITEIAYSVTSNMVIITTSLTNLEKLLQARR